ncbi:hypothetical protein D6445_24005 [Salmonella enterica subsp. enterica serovar Infantis]|nr:hypothetical protein [Salmonella enterica subsp. enterica serovar Infantis]
MNYRVRIPMVTWMNEWSLHFDIHQGKEEVRVKYNHSRVIGALRDDLPEPGEELFIQFLQAKEHLCQRLILFLIILNAWLMREKFYPELSGGLLNIYMNQQKKNISGFADLTIFNFRID